MVKSYSEIEKIEKNCIYFIDGTKIQFDECIRRDTNMCIAESEKLIILIIQCSEGWYV